MVFASRTSRQARRVSCPLVGSSTLSASLAPIPFLQLPDDILLISIGHEPATALVRSQVETDPDGYVITVPGTTQTSVKGVFAAGDVQDKKFRQAITSAGSGCMAALEVEKFLAEEEHEQRAGHE
jgi:pyruvate/2-oxoglutarate dehydrogenase complex dihydrolipoamide dehydrogenase (E3) component